MIPNGYLIFEDESFLDSTVAKMNALRKSGQFCDVRLQVRSPSTPVLDSTNLFIGAVVVLPFWSSLFFLLSSYHRLCLFTLANIFTLSWRPVTLP